MMLKLFFSALAGFAIFMGLLTFQVIAPLLNSVDALLGAGALRLTVSPAAPLPPGVISFIDEHPQLALRIAEASIVVLLTWSSLLLLTHWGRQLVQALRSGKERQAVAASRQLAAMAARRRDSWS